MLLIGTHPGGFTALTAAAGPAFASQADEPATEVLSWKGEILHQPSAVYVFKTNRPYSVLQRSDTVAG